MCVSFPTCISSSNLAKCVILILVPVSASFLDSKIKATLSTYSMQYSSNRDLYVNVDGVR